MSRNHLELFPDVLDAVVDDQHEDQCNDLHHEHHPEQPVKCHVRYPIIVSP